MREELPALNGLRIFAALGVVSFHYGTLAKGFPSLPQFFQNAVRNGTVALPFFFILSGFVLTHAYSSRISVLHSPRKFYLARFARLYPVYLFSFLLFLPMALQKYLLHPAVTEQHGLRDFSLGGILALFLLQSWTPLSQAWNGPGWSLSVETLFYLLFPYILLRTVRVRSRFLFAGLAVLWVLMISLAVEHERNIISPGTWHSDFNYQPLFWTPMFLLGIAAYRLKERWSHVPSGWATLISVASVVLLLSLCCLPPNTGGDFLVNGGAAPLMVLIVLAFSHPRSLSSRIMGGRTLVLLGGASYVAYILQAPLWHMFRLASDKLRHVHGASFVADWQFLLYLPFLIGVSLLVQRFVEKPARRWLMQSERFPSTASARRERSTAAVADLPAMSQSMRSE